MSNISHNSMSFSPLDALLCVYAYNRSVYIKHFGIEMMKGKKVLFRSMERSRKKNQLKVIFI